MPPPGFHEAEGTLHVHAGTPEFEELGVALRGNGKLTVGGEVKAIEGALVVEGHVDENDRTLEARDVMFKPRT